MFTLVAYSESEDTSNVLTYVTPLPDQHVRVEGDNVIVPDGMANLLGVFAVGPNITAARVETPALRRMFLLDLPFVDRGAAVPSSPHHLLDLFYMPIPLDEFEPMRTLAAEDGTGAIRSTVLIWLGDGPQSAVSGEIFTVRATSSVTLTAFQWTNGALTLTQTLPAGRYQVVGASAVSAGLIAARLVFVGGTWRPGFLGRQAVNHKEYPIFRRGGLGVWGEFSHDQPPTVDWLSSTADTSETIWLDLIKVA